MRYLVLIIAVAAVMVTVPIAARADARCYYPDDYGATVNDGASDRLAIMAARDAALANHGDLCFGPGEYTVRRFNVGNGCTPPDRADREQGCESQIGAIQFRTPAMSGLVVRGAGKHLTTIAYRGEWPVDSYLFEVREGVKDITFRDFAISTRHADLLNEHSYGMGGGMRGAANITVDNVRCDNPSRAGMRVSDCFQFMSPPLDGDYWAKHIKVTNVECDECGRALLLYQYGVDDLELSHSRCGGTPDQCVDGEVSKSTRTPDSRNIRVINNAFTTGNQSGYCMGLAGQGFQADLLVSGNTCTDGGIRLFSASGSVISGNRLNGPVDLLGAVEDVSVTGNMLMNSAYAPVMSALCHNTKCPSRVSFVGNVGTQLSDTRAVNFSGVIGLVFAHNTIDYRGATPRAAIGLDPAPRMATGISLVGNFIRGATTYLLSAPAPAGLVVIQGNATEQGQGAWFQNGVQRCTVSSNTISYAMSSLVPIWSSQGLLPGSSAGCTEGTP